MLEYQIYGLLFLGGGLGTLARARLGKWLNPMADHFFWGTFSANIAACLLLGVLAALLPETKQGTRWAAFLGTGFCGGFSTFSTFGLEGFRLLRMGRTDHFLLYMGISLAAGLLAVALAYTLARNLFT